MESKFHDLIKYGISNRFQRFLRYLIIHIEPRDHDKIAIYRVGCCPQIRHKWLSVLKPQTISCLNGRDRIVVSTSRCGRDNPGSNPGHGRGCEVSIMACKSAFFLLITSIWIKSLFLDNRYWRIKWPIWHRNVELLWNLSYSNWVISSESYVPKLSFGVSECIPQEQCFLILHNVVTGPVV